jgi:hypothetical protein
VPNPEPLFPKFIPEERDHVARKAALKKGDNAIKRALPVP